MEKRNYQAYRLKKNIIQNYLSKKNQSHGKKKITKKGQAQRTIFILQ